MESKVKVFADDILVDISGHGFGDEKCEDVNVRACAQLQTPRHQRHLWAVFRATVLSTFISHCVIRLDRQLQEQIQA